MLSVLFLYMSDKDLQFKVHSEQQQFYINSQSFYKKSVEMEVTEEIFFFIFHINAWPGLRTRLYV